MAFHATVVQVLIASPGDTSDARRGILEAFSRWNGRHAQGRSFVLSPWLYELHSTPVLGNRPQAIINQQGVDKSDVVVAVFGARLGTDTGVDVSGTAEEIHKAIDKRVPVHVYFSAGDLPNDVDVAELKRLRAFKTDLRDKGLLGEYTGTADLTRQVIDALEYDLDAFEAVPAPEPPSGVKLHIEHVHEKEQKGFNKRNEMEYRTTCRDLVVRNEGDATAERLQIRIDVLEDRRVDLDSVGEDGWTAPRDLTDGSSFGLLCVPRIGRTNADITARWFEGSQERTKTITTQIT